MVTWSLPFVRGVHRLRIESAPLIHWPLARLWTGPRGAVKWTRQRMNLSSRLCLVWETVACPQN